MSDKDPRPRPPQDAQDNGESLLPPRMRMFKHTQETFEPLLSQVIDAAPERSNLEDYDEDEIEAYKAIIEKLKRDNVGMHINFKDNPDDAETFRGVSNVSPYAIQKSSSGLFELTLIGEEEELYPNSDMRGFAKVVISSELQPFILDADTDVADYLKKVTSREVEPDYLTDEEAQQLMSQVEVSELDVSSTLATGEELDEPDYWLHQAGYWDSK